MNPDEFAEVVKTMYALTQRNLVYNHNFLYFSNQTDKQSNHPDGWVYADKGSGGKIVAEKGTCQIFTGDNASMTFQQALHEFPRWQDLLLGRTVSAIVRMNISKDCEVKVNLSDGVETTTKTYKASLQEDYVFELSIDINKQATSLVIQIETNTNNAVLGISKVFANIGEVAIESLPCVVTGVIGERKQYIATQNSPAEELPLCNEAKELTDGQTRLNSVLNNRFGKGQKYSMLPDVRGLFSRAWDNGAGKDTDAADRKMLGNSGNDPKKNGDFVGTEEEDVFKEHLHDLNFIPTVLTGGDKTPGVGLDQGSTSKTKNQGKGETRPKNFAELYTIKWA